MLSTAAGIGATQRLGALNARSRSAGKRTSALSGESRLKNGLGISPLRATSGPPSVLGSALSGTGLLNALSPGSSGSTSALVQPALSGQGLLSQLQGQAQAASPLTAGLATASAASGGGRSLGVLQANLVRSRQAFQKIDAGSRLLQAARNPLRTAGGFGLKVLPSLTAIS